MQRTIYFDYASLVPPVPEAIEAMRHAAETMWGQPGALHSIGGRALYALDTARRQVADYLGTTPQEVVFTSSGREALAVGFTEALARLPADATIASSRLEHPALQQLVEGAAASGYTVHWLTLPGGAPTEADRDAIRSASLVALSTCNHELGTSLLSALGEAAPTALRVIDAVQSAPWISLAVLNDERTFYALSGAKLGATMGIGALRVPSRIFYEARNAGRHLERESPPWLAAIGLGAACAAREGRRDELLATACARADELLAALRTIAPALLVNGALDTRLGPVLNLSFPGQYGKSLVAALSLYGICISHTAACQARRSEYSPVVRAAYASEPERAVGATRWSVSERVTSEDIACAVSALKKILAPVKNGEASTT